MCGTVADSFIFGISLGGIPTDILTAAGLGVLVVLVALSGFFSSAEIAMFSLAQHRLEALVEDGAPGSDTVQSLKRDPHRLLVTILVGNNIVNIAMSSLATVIVGFYFDPGVAVLASTFGVTAIVLLFGESAPKSYAIENTESWALAVARPIRLSEYALYPLVVTFDYLTRAINRATGGGSPIESSYVTREEISELIRVGESNGVIEPDEREMLRRVLRFSDTIVKEVMTPRLDIVAVPKSATVEEAITECVENDHTRLPVYEGNLDTVVGVVELGDLIEARRATKATEDVPLDSFIKDALSVPESKYVDDLFDEMRSEVVKQAIVIDEFGTTEGLVTMEDIIEAIVGDILGKSEDDPIEFLDDQTICVDGRVNIDVVNDVVAVDFPEGEEFETIAGFVFNRAGRLVEQGETIAYGSAELTVTAVEESRIERVQITDSGLTQRDSPKVAA